MFPFVAKTHRFPLFALICTLVAAVNPSAATADTLTVTVTDDDGPGSLRQAIIDANANAGPDDIVFNIPTTDARHNGSWWTISIASELPAVTDSGTRILGFSQTANQGDTNPGVLGTGGTVGVDEMELPQYERPEIHIDAGGFNGLTVGPAASDILIEGVSIANAENGIVATGTLSAIAPGTNRVVRSVVVGLFPDGNDPGALRNRGHGVVVEPPFVGVDATRLTVEQSYVGYNGQVGIVGIRGATVLDVSFCEVFSNGLLTDAHDGIDVNGDASVVRYNLSRDNTNVNGIPNSGSGHGIEAGSQAPGTGGHVIENNTVMNNLGAGIAIRAGSSGNLVSGNIATGNAAGLYVNAEQQGTTEANRLTQNSTFENTGLGIDLHAEQSGVAFDGVTLNSPSSGQGGSNRLVAYPVFAEADLSGDTLTLSGFGDPGGIIEVFESDADPTGFGEGSRYLFTVAEGSTEDEDGTSGTYGPVVNGDTVSTEELSANRFAFTVVVPGVQDSVLITATQSVETATRAGGKLQVFNTSEFGPAILAKDAGSPVAIERNEVPGHFRLEGAYPNPFNPATTIVFELERPGLTMLRVYNALGLEVARLLDRQMPAGSHRVGWDARDLPSGTYMYRLTVDGETLAGTVTLLK